MGKELLLLLLSLFIRHLSTGYSVGGRDEVGVRRILGNRGQVKEKKDMEQILHGTLTKRQVCNLCERDDVVRTCALAAKLNQGRVQIKSTHTRSRIL